MEVDAKKEWDAYVAAERQRVTPLLARAGITLDARQPQTIGERYLTRPVGSGRKVVWFGTRASDGMRVVVKSSSEPLGIRELAHESRMHDLLERLRFAYSVFALPKFLLFDAAEGILVSEYVEQETPFLGRSLREQFSIALDAFKAQESAHAVTAGHWAALRKLASSNDYFIRPGEYAKIADYANDLVLLREHDGVAYAKLAPLLDRAIGLVDENLETLERYSGFLTHWDFMPQNFRIRDGKLYLLDLTSIRFGNKYEGWARFVNFMELYNPELAQALIAYVRLNRTAEEVTALKVMRAYRLIELIRYYATWLTKTRGDTLELAKTRIAFWTDVLTHVLDDTEVPPEAVEAYRTKRDTLRSEDEKRRQQGLH